jgi:hypothetical protein
VPAWDRRQRFAMIDSPASHLTTQERPDVKERMHLRPDFQGEGSSACAGVSVMRVLLMKTVLTPLVSRKRPLWPMVKGFGKIRPPWDFHMYTKLDRSMLSMRRYGPAPSPCGWISIRHCLSMDSPPRCSCTSSSWLVRRRPQQPWPSRLR